MSANCPQTALRNVVIAHESVDCGTIKQSRRVCRGPEIASQRLRGGLEAPIGPRIRCSRRQNGRFGVRRRRLRSLTAAPRAPTRGVAADLPRGPAKRSRRTPESVVLSRYQSLDSQRHTDALSRKCGREQRRGRPVEGNKAQGTRSLGTLDGVELDRDSRDRRVLERRLRDSEFRGRCERLSAEMLGQLAPATEGRVVNPGRKRRGRLVFGDATE